MSKIQKLERFFSLYSFGLYPIPRIVLIHLFIFIQVAVPHVVPVGFNTSLVVTFVCLEFLHKKNYLRPCCYRYRVPYAPIPSSVTLIGFVENLSAWHFSAQFNAR